MKKKFNIWEDYWKPLKKSNPKEYERRRRIAGFKANATKETNRLVSLRNTDKFQDIQKTIEFNRDKNWSRHNKLTEDVLKPSYIDINKMSRDDLIDNINKANEAIKIREQDFILNYQYETGDTSFGQDDLRKMFNRDDFDVNDNDKIQKLRHTLRNQQNYLDNNNTWEAYNEQLGKFAKRAFRKEGIEYSDLSLSFKKQYRKKFFDLYRHALEHPDIPAESKGSPVYAFVAEELSKDKNVTLDEIVEGWSNRYEAKQEEERKAQREAGADVSDFLKLSRKPIY